MTPASAHSSRTISAPWRWLAVVLGVLFVVGLALALPTQARPWLTGVLVAASAATLAWGGRRMVAGIPWGRWQTARWAWRLAWAGSLGLAGLSMAITLLLRPDQPDLDGNAERAAVLFAGMLAGTGLLLGLWRMVGYAPIHPAPPPVPLPPGPVSPASRPLWADDLPWAWRAWAAWLACWRDETARPILRWPLIIGLGLMAFVVQVNVILIGGPNQPRWFDDLAAISPHVQMLAYFGGFALAIYALGGGGRLSLRRPSLILLAILALALLVRLWDLETWTVRFLDELHYMNAVGRIWQGGEPMQILRPFSRLTAFTWAYPYLQSWSAWLTGPSFSGVRLMSVFFGVAQVGATYFLARQLFDRRTALLTACLLATFPPHLHFSRIGINNIADPFFGTLGLALLVRGLRQGRQMDFALAGACLGLTQYFYEGGRLFFVPFAGLWLGWQLVFGQNARWPSGRNLLILAASALLIIGPLYYVWQLQDEDLAPRWAEMADGIIQGRTLDDQIISPTESLTTFMQKLPIPARGWLQLTDTSWFYGGNQGFILWVLGPFFLWGVALAIWRVRGPAGLLVWWMLGAIVGNALIVDALSAPRYLVVFPAAVILLAYGMRTSLAALLAPLARRDHLGPALGFSLTSLALLATVLQTGYYALVHVPDFYQDTVASVLDWRTGRPFPDTNDALVRAVQLPPNTDVHIISPNLIWDFDVNAVRRYWGRQDLSIRHVFPDQFDDLYLSAHSPYRTQAFFLESHDGDNFRRILSHFSLDPTRIAVPSPHRLPRDVQFLLYVAPAWQSLGLRHGVAPGVFSVPTPVEGPIRAQD